LQKFGLIDKLTYTYPANSSQLEKINDEASEPDAQPFGFPVPEAAYGYDPAGNVISDAQRSLTYNAFNLPAMVTGAEGAEQAISYVGGTAFSRTNQDGEIRYYLDGLEVFKDKPASYSFAEGRLAFRDGEAHFQYRIADHLGNTVVLFEDKNDDGLITDNPNDPEASEVLQRKLYYPFGMELRGTSPVRPVVAQRYAYNGKELVEGIGLYDYGARWYDPVVGRWTSVDPLAGKFVSESPYNYAGNSPVMNIDVGGAYKLPAHFIQKYPHFARYLGLDEK
jgi:RHS repeat-associated protein